jgi:hypothetical protein
MFKIDNIYFYLIVAVPKSPTQMGSLSVKKTRAKNSHAWAPLTGQVR